MIMALVENSLKTPRKNCMPYQLTIYVYYVYGCITLYKGKRAIEEQMKKNIRTRNKLTLVLSK